MSREAVCSRQASPPDLALAQSLQLPLVQDPADAAFCAMCVEGVWGLVARDLPNMNPLCVDFTQGEWSRRRRELRKGGDILSKALGKVRGRRAVDATAGFGRDSLHLVALGFSVLAIERSALLVFLLESARLRALASEGAESELAQLTLVHGEAGQWLRQHSQGELQPDVVFIDPMFPNIGKSALAGKEMQLLQQLIPATPEGDELLLDQALAACRDRVIVKRPMAAPPLRPQPRHQYEGKAVRYDVYFPPTSAPE
ncbi:MAG: class I SAM-dependent methyltransferase [Bdellovibrionales bacterium]|nr:class I SAM-dependent methyltransferase [Bdellovibrionales bacterium]